MKRRYVTKQILLACQSKRAGVKKDIHVQLEETIAERRKILPEWEKLFLRNQLASREDLPVVQKDIHARLAETIAAYKRARKQSQRLFLQEKNTGFLRQDKRAA